MARIAFLTAGEGVERVELEAPWQAVVDAGHDAELLSTASEEVHLFDHLDRVKAQQVDRVVADALVEDYDALVLPGGVANPDALRMDEAAVAFVGDFVRSNKPVASICHAAWALVEADAVRGRALVEHLAATRLNGGETVLELAEEERDIRQGYLEQSGVNPTREMMAMIETSRAFEANTRLIQHQDSMISGLITRVLAVNS